MSSLIAPRGEIMKVLGFLEAEKVSVREGRHFDDLPPCDKEKVLMIDRIHERILREIILEPTLESLGEENAN